MVQMVVMVDNKRIMPVINFTKLFIFPISSLADEILLLKTTISVCILLNSDIIYSISGAWVLVSLSDFST